MEIGPVPASCRQALMSDPDRDATTWVRAGHQAVLAYDRLQGSDDHLCRGGYQRLSAFGGSIRVIRFPWEGTM
jgi:hypothetical protein